MTCSKSLSAYFKNTDPVTLDNCDREQIHLSDAIQPIGALLVVEPESSRVIAASENAASLLNLGAQDIFSLSIGDISADIKDQIAALTNEALVIHEVLDFEYDHDGIQYDVVTHLHSNKRIIEFLPNNSPSAQSARHNMRLCNKTCTRIFQSHSFDDGMQIAVDAIRDLTGFSRAKIYRFLPDWSGETIAESGDGQLESYLGLHFPATDIPQQVRRIMSMVPYRAIGTNSDDAIPIVVAKEPEETLDLTWSLLRSVSTMHTAYIRNMGVGATFSCSLMHQDNLWGLIACHHNEERLLPFDSWGLVQEISTALMLRYDQQQRTDVSDMIYKLRLIENQFASEVRKRGDVESVVGMLIPTLQKFLGADGFAFQYGTNLHMSGSTPPKEFVSELIKWSMSQSNPQDQFQTCELHKLWGPAKAHLDTACGVLIQPITVHRVCQLIWFRGPISKHVEWAGNPTKELVQSTNISEQNLQPRSSFKRWVVEHSEQSTPWKESELESAREIFKEFLDIIASQVLLKEENDSLRSFTANAAHDIRAPLRGITMALEAMDDDNFDEQAVRETHEIAQKSAMRLTELTAALLDLALITEQEHEIVSTDMNSVMRSVTELLVRDISDSNAIVEIDQLPTIHSNGGLLTRLFLNMVSNAMKYAHPDRTPNIRIRRETDEDDCVVISVSDNGIGIDHDKAETIFKPLLRLHTSEKIEGTGLGLTICKKVLEILKGSIRLDKDYKNGSCFLITLSKQI
ncbi:MAG: ATP-binding protein [Granulosicoccus sp.]